MSQYTNKFILTADSKKLKSELDSAQKAYTSSMDAMGASTRKLISDEKKLEEAELSLSRILKNKASYTKRYGSDKANAYYKEKIALAKQEIAISKRAVAARNKEILGIKRNTANLRELIASKKAALGVTKASSSAQSKYNATMLASGVATAKAKSQLALMTNGLVRHIRQMESFLVLGYGAYRMYKATLGVGHEYNKLLENEISGMKILAVQNLKDTDAMGKKLTLQEKYNIAAKESVKMVELARKINPETPYNLADTIKTYKALFPQLIKYKASLEDIAEVTKKMTILGKSMNLDTGQFIKTIDTAFSGQMKPSQMQIALNQVGITNESIKKWKENGTLVSNVIAKLSMINSEMSGISQNWDTATSNFGTVWQELWGELQKPLFDGLKRDIIDVTTFIKENQSSLVALGGGIADVSRYLVVAGGAWVAYKMFVLGATKASKAHSLAQLNLRTELMMTGKSAKYTGSMIQGMGFMAKSAAASLMSIGLANAPLIALTAVFEGWAYIANKNAEAQQRFSDAINKTTTEIKAMSQAQRAVALRDIALGLDKEIDKLNHLKHLKDKIIKQDELRRKTAVRLWGEERVAREFKGNTRALLNAQSELDTQQKIVNKLNEQKELWEQTDLSIQGASWSAKEMSTQMDSVYKSANNVAGGANSAKISISNAANEAARLAQNLMNAVAALNGALRGQAVLKGVMNQAQATYEGLAETLNNAKAAVSSPKLAVLGMGGTAGDSQRLKYTTEQKKIEQTNLKIAELRKTLNLEGVAAASEYQAVQIQNAALEKQILGDKNAQHEATIKTIAIERQALVDRAVYDASYRNSLQYQTDLNKLKQRELQEQVSINKEASKGGGGSKKSNAEAKKRAKAAKKEAEKFTSSFTSLIDKMLSGDWTNLFGDFFSSIGKNLMQPFIKDMSTQLSKMISDFSGNMKGLGGFAIGAGISLAGSLIGSLFSNEVSQAEIDAAKGKVDFSDDSINNLQSAYESVMYPMTKINQDMRRYLRNMDANFYSVARALGASSSGIDLAGNTFVETEDVGFLGFSSKSISLIGTGLKFAVMDLGEAMNAAELDVLSYTTTLVKKSSFWGLFKSSKIKETYKDLPDEVIDDMAGAFASGYEAILTSGVALGLNQSSLRTALENAKIDLGKIDFTGLSQEEIANRLEQAYSTAFSGVIDGIGELSKYTDRYAKANEAALETLGRLALEVDQSTHMFNMLGTTFKTLGDYTAQMQQLDIVASTGGIQQFSDAMSSYMSNFFTESEQLGFQTTSMTAQFAALGKELPKTKEAYVSLLNGIDRTTEEGNYLYGQVLLLADGFATMTDASERLGDATASSVKTMLDLITGDLSTFTRLQKTEFAERYARTQTDISSVTYLDAARLAAETAIKTTATKDEYSIKFERLLLAQEAQVKDATNKDLLKELTNIRQEVKELREAQEDTIRYSPTGTGQ